MRLKKEKEEKHKKIKNARSMTTRERSSESFARPFGERSGEKQKKLPGLVRGVEWARMRTHLTHGIGHQNPQEQAETRAPLSDRFSHVDLQNTIDGGLVGNISTHTLTHTHGYARPHILFFCSRKQRSSHEYQQITHISKKEGTDGSGSGSGSTSHSRPRQQRSRGGGGEQAL